MQALWHGRFRHTSSCSEPIVQRLTSAADDYALNLSVIARGDLQALRRRRDAPPVESG